MSTKAASLPAPIPSRMLTPEASNVLGWWWLAIVTTIVLLVSMWPSIFPDTGASAGGMASTSTYMLVILCAILIAVGAWAGHAFAKGQPWSAGTMRLVAMIGLGVGLAGVGYFLYSIAFSAAAAGGQTFWGPSPVLSGMMWGLIILLPFIFGLTLIFGLMNDAVDEWLNPSIDYEATTPSMPRAAAAMAGSTGSARRVAAPADEQLMGELSEAMSISEKNASLQDDDHSVEVIGSAEDDLSVEVIGGSRTGEEDSMEELAALEQALTKDASKKGKKPKKKEEKLDGGPGDGPLKVDDDFKL